MYLMLILLKKITFNKQFRLVLIKINNKFNNKQPNKM